MAPHILAGVASLVICGSALFTAFVPIPGSMIVPIVVATLYALLSVAFFRNVKGASMMAYSLIGLTFLITFIDLSQSGRWGIGIVPSIAMIVLLNAIGRLAAANAATPPAISPEGGGEAVGS